MYCTRKVTDDLTWVGANDRRMALFEAVYTVPEGMSYNSYLLTDEKTVLFDTVDKAVRQRFLENIDETLKGGKLDYLIVQHVEPDHSAVIPELIRRYPEIKIICSARALKYIKQFYDFDIDSRVRTVEENETLNTGKHTLQFVMAPMVHWPEVMLTYDSKDKILFSADAFGCFGALNGALFADEVDFEKGYMDEARRYYSNIVGKYGTQVDLALDKMSALKIEMICPLHGFVWRSSLSEIVSKYMLWSKFEPEERGVMIAYASVYGNTENAAEILACRLRDKGIKTVVFDVSVTPAPQIVSAVFKWSHLVFASTTYNAGIFVTMEALINDLTAHTIRNRKVAIIENGSWAPTSGGLIRENLSKCENINFIENNVSILSGLKAAQLSDIEKMAEAISADINAPAEDNKNNQTALNKIDPAAMFKLSYGLFVLTARDGDKDNGCIINTVMQVTVTPVKITIAVNKANYTHDMILKTRKFNISVLSEGVPFRVFQHFGFQSGKETDKFADFKDTSRSDNGIRYVSKWTNGVISAEVKQTFDCGTHTLFIAEVSQAFSLSHEPSVTYQYYFDNIKPKPQPPKGDKKGFVCKICGYVHEGDTLPEDFICPLCKHGAADFERI
jgi:flavorubredoxin/flavin reductase (DIM6/NTAB) family NADH-FMN oxidoreductase RutF